DVDVVERALECIAAGDAQPQRGTRELEQERPLAEPARQAPDRAQVSRSWAEPAREQLDRLIGCHHLDVHPLGIDGYPELARRDQPGTRALSLRLRTAAEWAEVGGVPDVVKDDQACPVLEPGRQVGRRVLDVTEYGTVTRQRGVKLGESVDQ